MASTASLSLLYGKEQLPFGLPAGARATVIRKGSLPVMADPAAGIRRALENPSARLPSGPWPEATAAPAS